MGKFIKRIAIFGGLVIFFLLLFAKITSWWVEENQQLTPNNTESNTLVLKKNQNYDITFIGLSHGRIFSRYNNQKRVEKILGTHKIMNLSQGDNICGMNEFLFYLKYFYSQGNHTDKLVFTLTAPMMYNPSLNQATNTFKNEAFEFSFAYNYLMDSSSHENKATRLFYYISSKLHPDWFLFHNPYPFYLIDKDTVTVKDTLSKEAFKEGLKMAQMETLNEEEFDKNIKVLVEILQLTKKNKTEVIFIVTPTLFGKWPGHGNVEDLLSKLRELYPLKYYDFSESINDPKLYSDNHHLNSDGIVLFTEKYLKPVLEESKSIKN